MVLHSLRDLKKIRGKKILVRVDYNLPDQKDKSLASYTDDRIRLSLPTLRYLLQRQAVIVLITHLGRPGGRIVKKYQLDEVAKRISRLLKRPIIKLKGNLDDSTASEINRARPRSVYLLDNIRFYPGEEKNNRLFAKKLSLLGDYYVNEAFSSSHREHASMVGIPRFLPAFAGFNLEREVKQLHSARHAAARPVTVIIGGSKISSKIGLIKKFIASADQILLGGALANTALQSRGIRIGASLSEPSLASRFRLMLKNKKITVPVDVVTAKSRVAKSLESIQPSDVIYDIGPQTVKMYAAMIKRSKTIIWNGPMGLIEKKSFRDGTHAIVKAICASRARVVCGGGETLLALRLATKKIPGHIFVSSGGGAMLTFLETGSLPALKQLYKK